MGDIGTPMDDGTIPAVGTSGTSYASLINAFLTEVKQRLEDKIPFSSILVSALDMANNAIENIAYALLYPQDGTPTEPVGSLQNFGGDLWWVSPSGAAQITVGDAVNSASIGGITGDYGGANPAQLRFVDADEAYYHYDDFSAGEWAFGRFKGVEIAGGDTSIVRVRLSWAGSSSYTITLPTDAPASTSIMQMDSSGNITASNTLATNQSITLAGTASYKHGDMTIAQSPGTSISNGVGAYSQTIDGSNNLTFTMTGGGCGVTVPIHGIKKGDRLKSIRVRATSANEPTITILQHIDDLTSTTLAYTSAGTIVGSGVKTMTLTSPSTLANAEYFHVKVVSGAGAVVMYSIQAVYDRP